MAGRTYGHAVLIDLFNTQDILSGADGSKIGGSTAAHSALYGLSHGAYHCHCEMNTSMSVYT